MSLTITANPSLKAYNSFGVAARAAHFAEALDEAEVREALALAARNGWALRPIGGGSNLLLTGDQDALVLRMALMGKRVLSDDGETVVVEAEAGEPWHPFVLWTLEQGLGGRVVAAGLVGGGEQPEAQRHPRILWPHALGALERGGEEALGFRVAAQLVGAIARGHRALPALGIRGLRRGARRQQDRERGRGKADAANCASRSW